MKKPFKVGDRIVCSVLTGAQWITGTLDDISVSRIRGAIVQIKENVALVESDHGGDGVSLRRAVHLGGCRRLVKRERKSVWIHKSDWMNSQQFPAAGKSAPKTGLQDFIEFREVVKK